MPAPAFATCPKCGSSGIKQSRGTLTNAERGFGLWRLRHAHPSSRQLAILQIAGAAAFMGAKLMLSNVYKCGTCDIYYRKWFNKP